MRVSWLIPVRDCDQWLEPCVESILQDCTKDDEVVVVDDGSRQEQRKFLPSDKRVRYMRQSPSGIVAALERGRSFAKGEYIARMDGDDLNIAGRLSAQIEYLTKHPDCGVVGGQAQLFFDSPISNEGMKHYVQWVNGIRDCSSSLFVESPLFHPATLFSRALLDRVGGYKQGLFPEDCELWLRIAQAGYKLFNLPIPVVRIRDHGQRLTRTDERYSKKAFLNLKMKYLEQSLGSMNHVGIWGAGKGARPWISWFLQRGVRLSLFDSFAQGNRHGIPIQKPEEIVQTPIDFLFVAVGARGARVLIREALSQWCPFWKEGNDWRFLL